MCLGASADVTCELLCALALKSKEACESKKCCGEDCVFHDFKILSSLRLSLF